MIILQSKQNQRRKEEKANCFLFHLLYVHHYHYNLHHHEPSSSSSFPSSSNYFSSPMLVWLDLKSWVFEPNFVPWNEPKNIEKINFVCNSFHQGDNEWCWIRLKEIWMSLKDRSPCSSFSWTFIPENTLMPTILLYLNIYWFVFCFFCCRIINSDSWSFPWLPVNHYSLSPWKDKQSRKYWAWKR